MFARLGCFVSLPFNLQELLDTSLCLLFSSLTVCVTNYQKCCCISLAAHVFVVTHFVLEFSFCTVCLFHRDMLSSAS